MKNKYFLLLAISLIFNISLLRAQQFGPDVKTYPSPAQAEGQVSMDVSFNGWIYEAFQYDSGVIFTMSKDNGDTWVMLDSIGESGSLFKAKIVVAGNDTNYMQVYMVVSKSIVATQEQILYINTFNANGAFITNTGLEDYTYADTLRDFDIVTDYKFPSVVSSPYAIAVLYAKSSPYDSLFVVVSTDSGANYGAKQLVANTGDYFSKVSLAYGISHNYSDGRLFMAWGLHYDKADTVGNIFTAYTSSFIYDAPTAPLNIDSLYPTTVYQLRNPRIATSQSTTIDNDSGNITALLVVERIATGYTNSNLLGFDNFSAVLGNYWPGFDIVNDTQSTVQPDLSFDPSFNNFLLTYYNATTRQIPYLVNGFNLTNPSVWAYITQNIVNDTTKLVNPWPTVRINPVYTRAAFGWDNTYNGITQAMFDGEFRLPEPVITSLSPDTVIAGNSAFQLTVNGYGFSNTSYIYWAMDSLGTTFVNSTQLTATVAASLVTMPDSVGIPVYTPGTTGGGGFSNNLEFYIVVFSSINDLGGLNSVVVYPNPAANHLNISYAFTQDDKMQINMYDMNGQLVKELSNLNCASGNGVINEDISNLSPGMYQLVLNTDKGSTTRKISIVR